MHWLDDEAFNPRNAELNPICHLLALLEAHHILHVSRIRVNLLLFGPPLVFRCNFHESQRNPWADERLLDYESRWILLLNWGKRKLSWPISEIIPEFAWGTERIRTSPSTVGKSRTLDQQIAPSWQFLHTHTHTHTPCCNNVNVSLRTCHSRSSNRMSNCRFCDTNSL